MRRRAHLPPLELFSLIILLSPAFYLLSSLPSQSFVSFIMCGVVWVTLSSFFFPPDPAASSPPVHRLLSATVAPTQNRACPSSGMCQMSVGSPARVRAPPDNTALTFWTHSKRTAPHKLPVLSRSFAACTWPEMVLVARNASYLCPPTPRDIPHPEKRRPEPSPPHSHPKQHTNTTSGQGTISPSGSSPTSGTSRTSVSRRKLLWGIHCAPFWASCDDFPPTDLGNQRNRCCTPSTPSPPSSVWGLLGSWWGVDVGGGGWGGECGSSDGDSTRCSCRVLISSRCSRRSLTRSWMVDMGNATMNLGGGGSTQLQG